MRRAAGLLAILGVAGCGDARPVRRAADPAARVAVVVLENRAPGAVLRHGWLARAARQGGRAVNAVGERHPAQPYFVMLSGALTPLSDAQATSSPRPTPNLADQLDRHHVPWAAYMDGMPSPCFEGASATGPAGAYVKRHDPFLFFAGVTRDRRDCRSDVLPGQRLGEDIARRRTPVFTWITPNLCEDMHSCPVAAGERWMARAFPPLLRSLGPRGVLFVVADERTPAGRGGGPIPLVVLGGGVRPGSVDRRRLDHRALLATIEDLLGLGRLPATRGSPTLKALLLRR